MQDYCGWRRTHLAITPHRMALALACLLVAGITTVCAGTAYFTGASDNDGGSGPNATVWQDPDNWLNGYLPTATDDAILEVSGGWSRVSIIEDTVINSLDIGIDEVFRFTRVGSTAVMTLASGNLTKRTNSDHHIQMPIELGASGLWRHLATVGFTGRFDLRSVVTGNFPLAFATARGYSAQHPLIRLYGRIELTGTTGGVPHGITIHPRLHFEINASDTPRLPDTMPVSLHSSALRLSGQTDEVSSETIGPTTVNGLVSLVLDRSSATSLTLDLASLTRTNEAVALIRTTSALGADVRLTVSPAPVVTHGMVAPWMLSQAGVLLANNSADVNFVTYDSLAGFSNVTYTARTETDFATAAATEIVALTRNATDPSLAEDLTIWALKSLTDNTSIEIAAGNPTLSIGSGGLLSMSNNLNIHPTVDFGSAEGIVNVVHPTHHTLSFRGAIAGTGGLTILGTGRTRLHAPDNTFTGPVTVHEGELRIEGSGSGNGVGLNRAGMALPLRVSLYGTVALRGNDQTIGGLDGEGTLQNGVSAAATLTIARDDTTLSDFSGRLRDDGSGALSLLKTGGGTQVLSGDVSYTGATTVQDGQLVADGTVTNTAIAVNGGALVVNGTVQDGANVVTVSPTTSASAGLSGTGFVHRAVTIAAGAGGNPGGSVALGSNGHALTIGDGVTPRTFTLAPATTPGAEPRWRLAISASGCDRLVVNGDFVMADTGSVILKVDTIGEVDPQDETYTILTWTGANPVGDASRFTFDYGTTGLQGGVVTVDKAAGEVRVSGLMIPPKGSLFLLR